MLDVGESERLDMGRVYAVVSAKGGVGKTTTTTNLAAALAASGADVAVVDGDLGMANLAGSLGVDSGGATLHDVLAGEADLADATREGPHGMTVIPGSPDLDAFARADPEGLRGVLDALRAQYDYVLLDTGAGLSNDTVVPLTYVDEALLVSTTGRDALGDTEKTRQVAERLGIHVAGAVITRAEPDSPQNAAVGETLKTTVLSSIPRSDVVRDAGDAGEPLTTYAPGSSAAAAYRALAADLTGESVRTRGADEADEAGEADDTDATDKTDETDGDDAPDASSEEEPLVAVDVSGGATPTREDADDDGDAAADDDPLIETADPDEMVEEGGTDAIDTDDANGDSTEDREETSEANVAADDDVLGADADDADANVAGEAPDPDADADVDADAGAGTGGAESGGDGDAAEADGEEGVYTTSLTDEDEDDEKKEKKGLFGRFLG
ncbi:cell division ATPase MinD [Halogeometricum sp. S1BR25-6]|uniref:Cell division ATPase MinD n=1 Tax=Halogeometricum salsisoli TaxID=2950536 RepID=A0ABU2GBM8_9EURY|nr:cell division ATPase MinD [Halogeometricum sp. S1BR25-6]MDS0297594.1 cell division ATPase MinD [Halogeometricum sp. S1BR25-6]